MSVATKEQVEKVKVTVYILPDLFERMNADREGKVRSYSATAQQAIERFYEQQDRLRRRKESVR